MKRPEGVARMVNSRNARTGIRVNNSRIRSQHRITGRQVLLIVVMLFLFMGSGIGYVWSNFEKTQIGYDLSRLKQEELRLKEINLKLRLELALLKSPENLESQAVNKLGLGQPTPEQIVILP